MAVGKTHFSRTGGAFWTDSLYHYGEPSGNVFWCGSTLPGAATGNTGRTPEDAFSTLTSALGSVTADNNDVILVASGHVETITGAAGVNLTSSHNGVSIIGLGTGRQRPTVNYTTATAASFDVGAARCAIRNLTFTPTGVDAVTAAVNVTAADVTIEDCEFELATASAQATLGVLTTAAADRFAVRRCFFHGSDNAGTAAAVRLVGTDAAAFESNRFIGNYTTSLGAIDNATTACTNALVIYNWVYNRTAASTVAFNFQAGSTGIISQNYMQILSGTAPIVGAAMAWLANSYAATIATTASAK